MECIGLRYFNVFGPRQDPNSIYAAVIPKFIAQAIQDLPITINGDGSYTRDFTFIDNVVKANYLALFSTNSQAFGQVFNIGAGGRVSILEVYQEILHCLSLNSNNSKIIYNPIRPGDVPHSNADITMAKNCLNYVPSISFKEGISKLIKTLN